MKDYLTNAVIIDPIEWRIEVTLRKPSNLNDNLFFDIETNLIKNKCAEVLKSVRGDLNRRQIFFRSIDVQTIESEPEETIEKLLEEEITEETYAEIAEEYENVSSWKPGKIIKIHERAADRTRESGALSDEALNSGGRSIVISKK